MVATKSDIIARLQKEILPLQGLRNVPGESVPDFGIGSMKYAFPNAVFPIGAVHEFICGCAAEQAATGGFIAGLLSTLMRNNGICVWINASGTIFPPALRWFGIQPEKIIFVRLQKDIEILWAIEESLKCSGLAAVVGELKELDFTSSRRLQLAVEQSRVTGFIVRNSPRSLNTTACVTRWKVSSLPGFVEEGMPGIGFPGWNIELLKARNGKPGNWKFKWINQQFREVTTSVTIIKERERKVG
jgi:protein ImuA